jgi:hypothetical protein
MRATLNFHLLSISNTYVLVVNADNTQFSQTITTFKIKLSHPQYIKTAKDSQARHDLRFITHSFHSTSELKASRMGFQGIIHHRNHSLFSRMSHSLNSNSPHYPAMEEDFLLGKICRLSLAQKVILLVLARKERAHKSEG